MIIIIWKITEALEKNHLKNNMASISSKKREAGKLNKRCLTLDEKIKILDIVKKRKMSCRKITEQFRIGNTQAANVVKSEASLRAEYENFQVKGFKHLKRENHQKYKVINKILYKCFKKCEASGIYVSGSLLKEEAMNIKDLLNNSGLNDFRTELNNMYSFIRFTTFHFTRCYI